jgi:hypothetical protein
VAAKFVRLDGEWVVLENREGREFQIRRDALSEGDRALLDASFGVAEAPAEAAVPAAAGGGGVARPSAPGRLSIAGVPFTPGGSVEFSAPIRAEDAKLVADTVKLTTAKAILWTPPDFDPSRPQRLLVVSRTSHSLARGGPQIDAYLEAAREAGGWAVLQATCAEPDAAGTDACDYRWAGVHGALLALAEEWPGAREWPMALAGHSGGAKFTSYLAAALCGHGWRNVAGMWLGGCNQHFVERGASTHRAERRDLLRIPVYLSSGKDDTVATPRHMSNVRDSLSRYGFKKVRLESAPGDHRVHGEHLAEALRWFLELAEDGADEGGGGVRGAAGGGLPLRPSRIPAR